MSMERVKEYIDEMARVAMECEGDPYNKIEFELAVAGLENLFKQQNEQIEHLEHLRVDDILKVKEKDQRIDELEKVVEMLCVQKDIDAVKRVARQAFNKTQ